MPPEINDEMIIQQIFTTYDLEANTILPKFTDLEGDKVYITVEDSVNYKLGLHAQYTGLDKSGDMEYEIQSFILKETINAIEGESTITVTWADINSGQTI